MLTEEQRTIVMGYKTAFFVQSGSLGKALNIPKITNRILSAVLAASCSCELLHLDTRRTAERILCVSLLKTGGL